MAETQVNLATQVKGTLPATNGGTGAATLTQYAVLLGAGTGAVQFATIGTGGRLLIDQGAGANPAFTAVTGDATLSAAGVLTIASSIAHAGGFVLENGDTTSTSTVFTVGHNSTGTPGAGFGSVTLWTLESSTTADQSALQLATTWATATHGSRKARGVISVYDTAAREAIRVEASGTAAMVSFLGAAASAQLASPDAGTALVTFGFASGTPTFAAANLTGTTLPASIVTSSLTAVGTLTSGATGAGFTVALTTSTVTGTLPVANLTSLTSLTAADVGLTDEVPEYNAAASANRKVSVTRLGGFVNPGVFEARLTLTSGTAVTTSDVTAAATIYLTPFRGNRVALYDGTRHNLYALSEISLSVAALTPGVYDLWLIDSGGLALESLAWTASAGSTGSITGATNATPISVTSTSHGLATDTLVFISGVGGNTAANGYFRVTNTGANTFTLQNLAGTNVAGSGTYTSGGTWWRVDNNTTYTRATALTTQDGVLYKNGALTRRYVGTIFIQQTGKLDDGVTNRFVWNYYNRAFRDMLVEQTNSHTYATGTWRVFNNDFNNQLQFVVGVVEDGFGVTVGGDINSGTGHLAFAPNGVTGTNPSLRHSGAVTNRAAAPKFIAASLGFNNIRIAQFGAASTAYAYAGVTAGIWM